MSSVVEEPGASRHTLRSEILAGLARTPKTLSPKLLYDPVGARLFEEITTLDEYYLTRTEVSIFRSHLPEIAAWVGPRARIVEPGSGSGEKTRLLLDALEDPVAYLPVDIAAGQLHRLVREMEDDHPELEVLPVPADYTRSFHLPESIRAARRTVVFFPGSTIGNFEPAAARDFLQHLARESGRDGGLILGADLLKPAAVVEPAYNDSNGVTAAFNLNVLDHLNRILDADFRTEGFFHEAVWVPEHSRIEMHLVSRREQTVTVRGADAIPDAPSPHEALRIHVGKGERIVTEHSYKHAPEALERLTREGGWITRREWRDGAGWYSVRFLEVA